VINPDPFKTYLQGPQPKLATGDATEHIHRYALEKLIQALVTIENSSVVATASLVAITGRQ
jgi:hypothetical protein